MSRNSYIAVAAAVTAALTLAIGAAFAMIANEPGAEPVQLASVTVAVLQIASVMVVATLALSRARTRAFGWEAVAAAIVLTTFVIITAAQGVGSDLAMVLRPPIGLVGILAFTLFDTGRPVTRVDRMVTVPAALAGIVLAITIGITASVTPGAWAALPCTDDCNAYGLDLIAAPGWSTALMGLFAVAQAAASIACVVGLVQRNRRATGWRRSVIRPVAWFGGAYAVICLVLMLPIIGGLTTELPAWGEPLLIVRRLLLPLAIGGGMLVAVILQRQAQGRGLAILRDADDMAAVQDAVQRLVGDPQVRLVGANATGFAPAGFVRTDVRAPGGELLAVLEHHPARDEDEEDALGIAVPGAAMALDRLHSRDRLRTASAEERARMERDLHDGVQQHLVAMRMRLGMLEGQLDDGPAEVRDGLDDLIIQTEVALDELRALSRGEHLGVLSREGLHVALRGVAERTGRDVRLAGVTGERMPPVVEEALYFTCREALQNAMKHGDDTAPIIITAHTEGTDAVFEVSDVGDVRAPEVAAATARTIAERIAALGGSVNTFASAAGGRRITGRIPLVPASVEVRDA